jgi:hypothetical protein
MKLESRIRKAEKQLAHQDNDELPIIEVSDIQSPEEYEYDYARHQARKRLNLIQPHEPTVIFGMREDDILIEKYSNLTEQEARKILKEQEKYVH